MRKVLLSTVWGPYEEQYFNTSPTDVMNQRFSRGCDIFSMRGHLHINFAHLIAQNIDVPSVFLEYPGRETFLDEIDKGYEYVGISSFHNQVDELVEMCRAVRARAPDTQIVLGGWGAVGLEATLTRQALGELCDHLCHGEGVRFFRKLLGEQVNRPMFHSHLPRWSYSLPMINKRPDGVTPVVVGSLGCQMGCDFCGTTEMFKKKRLEVMSPEQVHMELKRAWRENPDTPQASILEEDSFRDKEYMQELGRLLREDPEFGLASYNFYCLASVSSISQWTFEEMMLTGCSVCFIGVESKFAQDNGYKKTKGRTYRQVFDGLHRVGIGTTGAWMIGFDFQDRSNIEEDLQDFISLEPTTQQLTRVCPFPATPMWKQMKEQGRIREGARWEEVSFYGGGGMKPKNFNDHEVMEIIERGYRQLYETHGASMARTAHVNLLGYEYCMENRHRSPYIGERGIFHKRQAMTVYPMLKAMEVYAPNSTVRKKMKDLRRTYRRLCGEPTTFQRTLEKALLGVSGLNKLVDVLYPHDNLRIEEPCRRYVYDKPAPPYPAYPYRVELPERPLPKAKANGATIERTRGFLRKATALSQAIDRVRGIEYDEAMRRGPLMFVS
ncbi:MAG: B12-binding domain-containing radical SAM protein [Myxococcota bacterium]